jgi:hypothetical protein
MLSQCAGLEMQLQLLPGNKVSNTMLNCNTSNSNCSRHNSTVHLWIVPMEYRDADEQPLCVVHAIQYLKHILKTDPHDSAADFGFKLGASGDTLFL